MILFATMLLLSPPGGMSEVAWKCAAVVLLMSCWWLTEAIPLPVTALLPLVLFPLLKILEPEQTAAQYADANIFLFMGGFFIAMAMQRWELHKRIALHIVGLIGTSPRKIILGFMTATAFLSLWISNTATTLMMLPVGVSVVMHLQGIPSKGRSNFSVAMMLGIAYAASIGGVGTLIGTPTNIVFTGIAQSMFPEIPEVTFTSWLKFGIPFAILMLVFAWVYMVWFAFPPEVQAKDAGSGVIHDELKKLGKMKPGERWTLIVFTLVSFAWIFRKNIDAGNFIIPGWADVLGVSKHVQDSTIAIAGAILLFLIPVNFKERDFVLNWEWAVKIPWGVILLFGGGFALAEGFQTSGLAEWIGSKLSFLHGLPFIIIIAIICLITIFISEIASNVATASMLLPILGSLAVSAQLHPFALMIPATMAASCGFMLPVATAPNAIAFGSGYVRVQDMARAGFFLNLAGMIFISLIAYFML
jgi:solute carrier family 13 (sodium-dependent dicarboxylate transporter), member 2/3/5